MNRQLCRCEFGQEIEYVSNIIQIHYPVKGSIESRRTSQISIIKPLVLDIECRAFLNKTHLFGTHFPHQILQQNQV
ncbi:hypothetical protein D3C72_1135530 [compost metagenome]